MASYGKLDSFKNSSITDFFFQYRTHLSELMGKLDTNAMEKVASVFLDARKNRSTIFFVGNGGSAATASHFAQDLAEVGRKADCPSWKTLALTDNVSFITAAANDYSYEKIFSIQMQELFQKGDVLVCISASGNSPNVVDAARCAKEKGGTTVALVGFDGGKLALTCDHVLLAPTSKGEYGPVEDVHMILDHVLTSYLYFQLKLKR